ncbi:MFS transporter [Microbaculum sp. FT89]|uniref:MFS transporter n=1 Tax=Microbaculum sp. FT89 TaxID=3447298 RepID=UPI003F53E18F
MRVRALDREGLRSRLSWVLATTVMVSVLVVGIICIRSFDRAVEPELLNRTRLIGSIVRNEIQRVLDLGIPFDAIVGLDQHLSGILTKFNEVQGIAIISASGQTLAAVARPLPPAVFQNALIDQVITLRETTFELPILEGNELVGRIKVETSPLFVQTRLREVLLDVMVVALVATLLALELALAIATGSVGKPFDRVFRLLVEQSRSDFRHSVRAGGLGALGRAAARLNDHATDLAQRQASLPLALRTTAMAGAGVKIAMARAERLRLSDIGDIRLALFLFSVATEISAAFLPLYARNAGRPDWLSADLAAAAPLVLYLVALAALSPFAGSLAQRFGARRLFLGSVPPVVVALAGMAVSDSLIEITFWRGVTAIFYATATISCQEYAIRAADALGNTRSVGAFVVVVYAGVFCGSALGGLIAGRLGFSLAFATGALFAAFSGVLGYFMMRGRAGDPHIGDTRRPQDTPRRPRLGARYLALLLGVAVPMNAATAILIWYLTPLTLADAGYGSADIARVVMLYYLAVVLFGPTVARLSDTRLGSVPFILTGTLASAAALLSLTVWDGFWAITLAVAGLGVGHTLIRAPLYSQAIAMTAGSGMALSVLRLVERVGAIIGLGASALLLGDMGAATSIRALGIAVICGMVLYAVLEAVERRRPGA